MNDKITKSLSKMFEKHRIVFWYDEKKELRSEYEELDLPGIVKLEINNNEYGIKYRALREEPQSQYLLYQEGPRPEDRKNWLLDLYLGHAEFRTDQSAQWLAELELGPEFMELTRVHQSFFSNTRRREMLKKRISPRDTLDDIKTAMLAVCCGANTDSKIDAILEALLSDLAEGKDNSISLISSSTLDEFLYKQLEQLYQYQSDNPSIEDLGIEIFKSVYYRGLQEHDNSKLNSNIIHFINRWKDSRTQEKAFDTLSAKASEVLDIDSDLRKRDLNELGRLDCFEVIDRKIISEAAVHIKEKTLPTEQLRQFISQRKSSHWYSNYEDFYLALDYAISFQEEFSRIDLSVDSLETGFNKYAKSWFRLDQYYRKFCFHYRESKQSLLSSLMDQIENTYTNNYLLPLGDAWQNLLNEQDRWSIPGIFQQSAFYRQHVTPSLRNRRKLVVIISDALRYEIGEELFRSIGQENQYKAELKYQQASLPSYTQLGMASLLPHQELSIKDNGSVWADGMSTMGTENRSKKLSSHMEGGALAMTVEDFNKLNRAESRELMKSHNLLYLYHNQIDATGDKKESEDRVFSSVENSMNDLITLIKKLSGANVSNMIITSDHGFVYQGKALDESDFVSADVEKTKVFYTNRRFLLGRNLMEHNSLVKYRSDQLGLKGDFEIQIPKSINRIRQKGSGSRFVHGGATLQEIVVPLIFINKRSSNDKSSKVDIDILRGSSSMITARQFAVILFQNNAVKGKLIPRKLRVSVYSATNELISDQHDILFDMASDEPREREITVRFVLGPESEQYSDQQIYVKLEEQEGQTSHYKLYKEMPYTLRLNAGYGFDF